MLYCLSDRRIRIQQGRHCSTFSESIFAQQKTCPSNHDVSREWNIENDVSYLIDFLFGFLFIWFRDVNTIFRGNSLVSKCIDELMKLAGTSYLHDTLKHSIETIILDNKPCEIDPNRIKDMSSLSENMNNLRQYISNIFTCIVESVARCPGIMCETFSALKELAMKYFPMNKDVCFYVISGFVFLRFFAPAILNPRLFELTDLNIVSIPDRVLYNIDDSWLTSQSVETNRTFTLISKTIQSIGNLVVKVSFIFWLITDWLLISFQNTQIKEDYMLHLYREFITEEYICKTKEVCPTFFKVSFLIFCQFLDSISSSRIPTKDSLDQTILKERLILVCLFFNWFWLSKFIFLQSHVEKIKLYQVWVWKLLP